ncbi:ArnT family glycosyltransferase [Nitrospira sp. Kam-Ns4a]
MPHQVTASSLLRWVVPLVVLSGAASGLTLAFHGVILHGDDVLYSRLAAEWLRGQPTFSLNNHPYRLGFLAPLAALYAVFGIRDWTTLAFTVVCSLATIGFAAYAARRLYGGTAWIWAALFSGFHPILYRSGSIGMPDVPAGWLYGLFVVSWTLVVSDRTTRRRPWAWISGVACAWAVATRESTAPMILLTLLGFAVLAWRRGTLASFPWAIWLLGCLSLALPYLGYLWWQTGSPLYVLDAAQGGYNIPGAPWLRSLTGTDFVLRVSGLSIVRASIEGYLFATLPVVVAAVLDGGPDRDDRTACIGRHLGLAVAAPLLILSHCSTTLTQWVPVHLDLRFGSPVILPAALLAAGVCARPTATRLSRRAQLGTGLAVAAAIGLLTIGAVQRYAPVVAGAAAALVTGLLLLAWPDRRRLLLPAVLVLALVANWAGYRIFEYPAEQARNDALRDDALSVPWRADLPILTDPLTAQVLPYLHRFEDGPRVGMWKGPGEVERPFYWADPVEAPWPRPHVLVWRPTEAQEQARRWRTHVPAWVFEELARGRLVRAFSGEPGAGVYLVEGGGDGRS